MGPAIVIVGRSTELWTYYETLMKEEKVDSNKISKDDLVSYLVVP